MFQVHAWLAVHVVPLPLKTYGNSFLISIIVILTRRERGTKHSLLARNGKLKFS